MRVTTKNSASFWKRHGWLLFYVAVYLASRIPNLSALPIFNDEAMYLNWGRLIVQSPRQNLFISLTDGQQPLFIWLVAVSYWLGQSHFLLVGRLISVFAGLGSMLVLWQLGRKLFSERVGYLAALVYILCPFSLWYDRLAIKDSFLMFLSAAIFYLAIIQGRRGSWRTALGSGLVLGLSLLTKSIAYFFVGLYVMIVVCLWLGRKVGKKRLVSEAFQVIVSLVLAFLIQSLMSFSPLVSAIGSKNSVFLLSLKELINFPINLWRNNAYSVVIWWWQYYRLPFLLVAGYGFWRLVREERRRLLAIGLLAWIILPIIFEVFTAKIFIPRYFLFTLTTFALFVAVGMNDLLVRLKKRWWQLAFGVIMFLPSLLLDGEIVFNLKGVNLPQVERWQYLEGWPAGYGLEALVNFLKEKYLSQSPSLLIVTEEETLVSSGLPLYLNGYPGVRIKRFFSLDDPLPQLPSCLLKAKQPVVIVLHHHQVVPPDWPVQEIAQIPRFGDQRFFLVYQLKNYE